MVRVYSGIALRTVRFTITLFVPDGCVRVGFAGVVTDAGLMTQVGVPVVCSGATAHWRATLTGLMELRALTLMVEVADCPPGNTAAGETGEATRGKSCGGGCAKGPESNGKKAKG